ncbi:MAG: AI-2E family transporter [Bifidobacterium sp.]|nr:AI-2E family transporter [Bifidobacterium sp.]
MAPTNPSNQTKRKLDLSSLFPSKGDPRRPPEWYGRALFYAVIAVYLGWFGYTSWGKISYIVLDIVIALFLALAVEPVVVRLVRHGWRRGAAAVTCLVSLIVIVIVLITLFGNMFVQQMISMMRGLPALYDQVATDLARHTDIKLPEIASLGDELGKYVKSSWVTDVAGQALSTTFSVFGGLLQFITAIMVAFYVAIAGPRLRRSLCKWIKPSSQRKFLMTWTVVQDQISGFLFSRTILAAISATCMSIFLLIIKVPYWLPLALFCGLVSQFVPTIGTYIGGALPVLFAWGERGLWWGVGVVVFITFYQQIENLLLSPKISERTMDLNPCVAFLSVLFFGSIFGALGAFLALPITASIQVLLKVSMKQYPLVDSPLMNDPKVKKKSKMIEAAEGFTDHVVKPVADRMPRQAKGSSGHVSVDDQIEKLQEYAYGTTGTKPGVDEDSPTVAIPKHVIGRTTGHHGLDGLRTGDGTLGDEGRHADDGIDAGAHTQPASITPAKDQGVPTDTAADSNDATGDGTSGDAPGAPKKSPSDNPRSHWR